MSVTVAELYAALSEKIPSSLSCEWDNDGAMCIPDGNRKVRRVLLTLDITRETVDEAVTGNYDVIISHHPLLFRGIRMLTEAEPVPARCITLCRSGVAALSFHTRLDALESGVNDVLASLFSLRNQQPLFLDGVPMGRVGELPSPLSLADFSALVCEKLGCPGVLTADAHKPVSRLALLGGEGGDAVAAAREAGADTFLSGRIGYHAMVDAPEWGMNMVEAGHYFTEAPVLSRLELLVREVDSGIETAVWDSNRIRFMSVSDMKKK